MNLNGQVVFILVEMIGFNVSQIDDYLTSLDKENVIQNTHYVRIFIENATLSETLKPIFH